MGGEGGEGGGDPGPVEVVGAVEKGPFIIGSTVEVSLLNAAGTPTGQTFDTFTTSDLGTFDLTVPSGQLALLEAQGFYFDEVRGDLSQAPVTLRAFADLSIASTVYINPWTHLIAMRVRTLVVAGATVEEATIQAQSELRIGLGIGTSTFDPGGDASETTLSQGDDDASAYLLAVGAVLLQAAVTQAGPNGPVDATFQQLLNTIAATFASSGTLTPELKAKVLAAENALDVIAVVTNLARRFEQLGVSNEVPNIRRAMDPDEDEVASDIDNCPYVVNPGQADADSDGVGDACECGNGVIDYLEACDDGNTRDADGCEGNCSITCEELGVFDKEILSRPQEIRGYGLLDDHLYFEVDHQPYGLDLATRAVTPLATFPTSVETTETAVLNDQLFFSHAPENQPTPLVFPLRKTDGTPAGTLEVGLSVAYGSVHLHLGNLIVGTAQGLARSDGSVAGTVALEGPTPTNPWSLGPSILFTNGDRNRSSQSCELWVSGMEPGTAEHIATMPGNKGWGSFTWLINSGPYAYFTFTDESLNRTLWRTDGTAAGTISLGVHRITSVTELDGAMYFRQHQTGIFRTDGSVVGTVQIASATGFEQIVGSLGGRVIYMDPSIPNSQLWATDGTASGTVQLGSLPFNDYHREAQLIEDHFVFGNSGTTEDHRLFTSDGTISGTLALPGITSSSLISGVNGSAYFSQQTNTQNHIWRCKM